MKFVAPLAYDYKQLKTKMGTIGQHSRRQKLVKTVTSEEELCRGSGGWVRQVEFKAGMSTMNRFFVVRQRSEKLNVVQQFNRIILKQAFNCYWQSGLILAGPEKLLNSRGVDDTRPIWRSIAYSKSMSESMSKSMSKSMSADGVGRALITEWFNITVCVYRQG